MSHRYAVVLAAGKGTRMKSDLAKVLHQIDGKSLLEDVLDACKPQELVTAIVDSDLNTLCRAKGVGKRTAERLALELRTHLMDRVGSTGPDLREVIPGSPDLIATLETLGYESHEIRDALQRLSGIGGPQDGDDDDAWLRACIKLLSAVDP